MISPAKAADDIDERFVVDKIGAVCDWKYAKKSWDSLQTLAQLKAERAKYAATYEPWVEEYLKDPRPSWEKLKELKQIPMDSPICRGFDLRVIYGYWQKQYALWQKNPRKPSTETFEVWRNKPKPCDNVKTKMVVINIDSCGPLPDWRSE